MKKILGAIVLLLFYFSISAQTFNGTTGPITDDGQVNIFTANVAGLSPSTIDTAHGLLSVCLNITHTYDSDLDVYLESPDGTRVMLFSGIGGGDDNFTGTCLSDAATTAIVAGSAPFSGTFLPMDVLGNVNNGQAGNGSWKLRITDTYGQDAGTLNSWSLTFASHVGGPFTVDSTNLPLVLIETYGQTIVSEPKINVGLKIINRGLNLYNHPADYPNVYNGPAGIEIRGSFSSIMPQKPYGIETRDSLGTSNNVSIFNMPSENDWILLALYNDKVFMRNSLAYKLFELCGHYAPRSRFCEVMINGSYQGIYLFTEKIKKDDHRVDIATLDLDDNDGDSLTGGYIIKLDYHDADNSFLSDYQPIDHPGYDVYYVYEYPTPSDITYPQKNYIQEFMRSLEGTLYGADFTDPVIGYRAWLDVPSYIDYMIVNEVARNNDGFKKSVVWYKDKDSHNGLLRSGPVWDFDWAWKNVNECSIFAATDGSGWSYMINDCNPDNHSNGWMLRLLQDSTFTQQLHCRWLELRQTILDTTYLFNYIDSTHALVEEAQARHYRKWPILGINVGTPEVDYQPTTYDGEISKFKNWIRIRLDWLDANMPGECPGFGIADVAEPSVVRIFPNPANDVVFIEADQTMAAQEIYDLSGRLVRSSSAGRKTAVDISDMVEGAYIVRTLFASGLTNTQKLIICR
jgi:subtilisin-like proprotein convertase family protein